MQFIYLLKIRGSGGIPDFLQVRDEQMHLIGYFKLQNWHMGLEKSGLAGYRDQLRAFIHDLGYGIITEFKLTGP